MSNTKTDYLVDGGGTVPERTKEEIGQIFERFLELPVAVVLAVLWVVGAVLEGACALALYLAGLVLVQTLAGT